MNGLETFAHLGRLVRLLFAGAALSACCHDDYSLKAVPGSPLSPALPSFVLISDTQYAVPYTDYDVKYQLGSQVVDLPPDVTTKEVSSYYRHAEAHFAVPLALTAVLNREVGKREFGIFGGDLVEFSCAQEAEDMFRRLEAVPKLPFIFAIGNHDATFHGTYDTDAVSQAGAGYWDTYSFTLWENACKPNGGKLTKSRYIRRLLDYYKKVWGWDFPKALGYESPNDYPLGKALSGSVHDGPWRLDFSFRLSAENSPSSHRQSYFYQRWTRLGQASKAAITVLDSVDYGSRQVLCDLRSKVFQLGLAGGITDGQVRWLESLPRVEGPQFVISHYLPLQHVAGIDDCETTLGVHCLGERLDTLFKDATYVYAHVHQPFEIEEAEGPATHSLVRLPSLIDNKSYVAFAQGRFSEQCLAPSNRLQSQKPFVTPAAVDKNTCPQRVREYLEIKRNIDCFAAAQKNPTTVCEPLAKILENSASLEKQICEHTPSDWFAANRASADKRVTDLATKCSGTDWPLTEQWRCILRGLSENALVATQLTPAQADILGMDLIATVKTLTSDPKVCAPPK